MDLSTTYLGLELAHPLIPGAGPLGDDIDTVCRLEDAGAPAIVLRSLFEEQVTREEVGTIHHMETHGESFPEALSYFPQPEDFTLKPDDYLEHIANIKKAVRIPAIASLNGTTLGGWLRYAPLMEEAGADALELNIYEIETVPEVGANDIEDRILAILAAVKSKVRIPVAVKLSPFYTSFAQLAHRLDANGADGLVIFNRFYQPDIDVDELEVTRSLRLSDSSELLLRLRWLAILSGQLKAGLAVTGGVHTVLDVVKAVMTGADAVQMVSALLLNGPGHLTDLRKGLEQWLEEHEYESLEQMRGSMNLERCPDALAYERVNYIETLLSWRGES